MYLTLFHTLLCFSCLKHLSTRGVQIPYIHSKNITNYGGINKGIKKIIFNKLGVIIYKRKERTHKTKHSQKAFKKSHISSNTAFFYQKQNN